jgi:hypothetical protein
MNLRIDSSYPAAAIVLSIVCLLSPQGMARPAEPSDDSEVRPPVTEADIRIVQRARAILDSPAKWNRADTRVCPKDAATFSFYCALEKATEEASVHFEHRGAAMQEARFVIDALVPDNHYQHRLMNYNNDPARTFADIQKALKLLEERIARRLSEQAARPAAAATVPGPSAATSDLQVIQRARALLDSPAKWNRADDRHCPSEATTFSLYCVLQVAAREGHANADSNGAIREARKLVDETGPNHAQYTARLTDYNSDPTTTFDDIQRLLRTVEERLTLRLAAERKQSP